MTGARRARWLGNGGHRRRFLALASALTGIRSNWEMPASNISSSSAVDSGPSSWHGGLCHGASPSALIWQWYAANSATAVQDLLSSFDLSCWAVAGSRAAISIASVERVHIHRVVVVVRGRVKHPRSRHGVVVGRRGDSRPCRWTISGFQPGCRRQPQPHRQDGHQAHGTLVDTVPRVDLHPPLTGPPVSTSLAAGMLWPSHRPSRTAQEAADHWAENGRTASRTPNLGSLSMIATGTPHRRFSTGAMIRAPAAVGTWR